MPYLVGIVCSCFIATVITWIRVSFHWDPMSFWVNLILPAGAIICGFLAALGFWIGSKFGEVEADARLMAIMLVCAAATFVSLDVFHYYALSIDGVPVSSQIGLGEFLQLRWTHGSMTLGHGSTAQNWDLGQAGFLLAFGKAAGFVIGYMASFGMIKQARLAAAH